MATVRKQLTGVALNDALRSVMTKLHYRANQKGMGTMASSHEILGLINEEVLEYTQAVQGNHLDSDKVEELKDIAVACIFGIASIESGGVDW